MRGAARARRAYARCAATGIALCWQGLARLCEEGFGMQQDLERALRLYKRAAGQRGCAGIEAMYRIAQLLPNSTEALWWLRRAGECGHGPAAAAAAALLVRSGLEDYIAAAG